MMDVKIEKPLLPLRDIVVFPNMVIPLFVGRDKSISALNEVMKKDKKIILVTQKNSEVDDPKKTDVFMYGCEGNILQLLKLPDGTVKVLVEGSKRVKILDFKDNALKEIAHKAINKKTGARGLRSILENILLKTMYDLPSQENVEEVIVDASAVKGITQPILVHSKNNSKTKTDKTSAA